MQQGRLRRGPDSCTCDIESEVRHLSTMHPLNPKELWYAAVKSMSKTTKGNKSRERKSPRIWREIKLNKKRFTELIHEIFEGKKKVTFIKEKKKNKKI